MSIIVSVFGIVATINDGDWFEALTYFVVNEVFKITDVGIFVSLL